MIWDTFIWFWLLSWQHKSYSMFESCLDVKSFRSPAGLLLSDTGPRSSESRHLSKRVMFQVNICKLIWTTLCVYAADI